MDAEGRLKRTTRRARRGGERQIRTDDCDIRHRLIAITANDNGQDRTRQENGTETGRWMGREGKDQKGTGRWEVA